MWRHYRRYSYCLYILYFLALAKAFCTAIFGPDEAISAYLSMHNLTNPDIPKLQPSGQGELTSDQRLPDLYVHLLTVLHCNLQRERATITLVCMNLPGRVPAYLEK
jgi:hypothetical protein